MGRVTSLHMACALPGFGMVVTQKISLQVSLGAVQMHVLFGHDLLPACNVDITARALITRGIVNKPCTLLT